MYRKTFSACKSATKYMLFVHFCKSSLGKANSSTEPQNIVFTVEKYIFRNTFEHRPELWESTQLINRLLQTAREISTISENHMFKSLVLPKEMDARFRKGLHQTVLIAFGTRFIFMFFNPQCLWILAVRGDPENRFCGDIFISSGSKTLIIGGGDSPSLAANQSRLRPCAIDSDCCVALGRGDPFGRAQKTPKLLHV